VAEATPKGRFRVAKASSMALRGGWPKKKKKKKKGFLGLALRGGRTTPNGHGGGFGHPHVSVGLAGHPILFLNF
jgi:hypothetical protein